MGAFAAAFVARFAVAPRRHARALSSRRRPRRSACTASERGGAQPSSRFEIVSHKRIFHRYQTVFQRDVRFPSGRTVSFDVLGNVRSDFKSVFVFPFNSARRTATLLREYAPGRNAETFSFVAGMYERHKHADVHEAARAELSEEARLTGGRLVALADRVAADKYSLNDYFFFLALDCERDHSPSQRDDDEWISDVVDVDIDSVRGMIGGGLLNTPNSLLGMLALDRLRHMGLARGGGGGGGGGGRT